VGDLVEEGDELGTEVVHGIEDDDEVADVRKDRGGAYLDR
jgi:hypothetical protein